MYFIHFNEISSMKCHYKFGALLNQIEYYNNVTIEWP